MRRFPTERGAVFPESDILYTKSKVPRIVKHASIELQTVTDAMKTVHKHLTMKRGRAMRYTNLLACFLRRANKSDDGIRVLKGCYVKAKVALMLILEPGERTAAQGNTWIAIAFDRCLRSVSSC